MSAAVLVESSSFIRSTVLVDPRSMRSASMETLFVVSLVLGLFSSLWSELTGVRLVCSELDKATDRSELDIAVALDGVFSMMKIQVLVGYDVGIVSSCYSLCR